MITRKKIDKLNYKIGILFFTLIFIIPIHPGMTVVGKQTNQIQTTPTLNRESKQLISLPNSVASFMNDKFDHVAPVKANNQITVNIRLKYEHQKVLNNYLKDLQNPSSQFFHQYLSNMEFVDLFAPNTSTYNNFVNYFVQKGFQVTKYNSRLNLKITGTFALFEAVFHTNFNTYTVGSKSFYAPAVPLSVKQSIGNHIQGMIGLTNREYNRSTPKFINSGSPTGYTPSDFLNAYRISSLLVSYPTQETIVVLGYAGTDSNGNKVGPYNPNDLNYYWNNYYQGPTPNIYYVPVSYTSGSSTITPVAPSTSVTSTSDTSGSVIENTLDIESAASTAPGANIIFMYEQYNNQGTSLAELINAVLNPPSGVSSTINSLLTSTSHPPILTYSWGTIGEKSTSSTGNLVSELQQASTKGMTVLTASGDSGDSVKHAEFPSDYAFDSYGIISVGGTTVTLTGTPSNDGSGTTGFSSQYGWSYSSGGVSGIISMPSWQYASADAKNVILGQSNGRGTPDIAAVADNMLAYYDGALHAEAGTSFSSPIVAGEIATMNNYLHYKGYNSEGFFLPLLYHYGQLQYQSDFPTSSNPFWDVTGGGTNYFPTKTGYDLVTGWGVINSYNFVQDQLNSVRITSPANGAYEYSDFYFSGTTASTSTIKLFIGNTLISTIYNTRSFNQYISHSSYTGWQTLKVQAADADGWTYTTSIQVNFATSSGGGGCVFQNTPILLADGTTYKKVQSIKTGDMLMGYSLSNEKFVPINVTSVVVTKVNKLIDINNGQLIVTLTDQPIYIKNSTYIGWEHDPQNLFVGEQMFDPVHNVWIPILSIKLITSSHAQYKVYDVITTPLRVIVANNILIDPVKF